MEHLIRISVDFGSTVSVIGWCLYERSNESGEWEPVPGKLWVENVPTLIMEAKDNPIPADRYGKVVESLLEGSAMLQYTPVAKTGFKASLYNKSAADHKEALRLTTLFLQHLREDVFEKNSHFSAEILQTAKKVVRYTTPVICASVEPIVTALKDAGFTPENGYDELERLDEANALADLAMQSEGALRDELKKVLSKSPKKRELIILIDLGGLTADINVLELQYDPDDPVRDYKLRQLAGWPGPDAIRDVNTLGGGIILDMAICEYMRRHGFVNEEATAMAIAQRGYHDFKRFKEMANDSCWMNGMTPQKLNGLGMDIDEGLFPPRNYKTEEDEQLKPERFLSEVAAPYIGLLTDGIREAIADANNHPDAKGLKVSEETIDWIFLTGGGSQIFFMRPLLMDQVAGQFGLPADFKLKNYRPLNFTKIKKEPQRLFGGTDEHSGTESCAAGALVYSKKLQLTGNADYDVFLDCYYQETTGYKRLLKSWDFSLIQKNDSFPKRVEQEFELKYTVPSGSGEIVLVPRIIMKDMEILTSGNLSTDAHYGKSFLGKSAEAGVIAGKGLVVGGMGAAAAAAAAGVVVAAGALQQVSPEAARTLTNAALGTRHTWTKMLDDKAKALKKDFVKFMEPTDIQDTLNVSCRFDVDENRSVTASISTKSKMIKGGTHEVEWVL